RVAAADFPQGPAAGGTSLHCHRRQGRDHAGGDRRGDRGIHRLERGARLPPAQRHLPARYPAGVRGAVCPVGAGHIRLRAGRRGRADDGAVAAASAGAALKAKLQPGSKVRMARNARRRQPAATPRFAAPRAKMERAKTVRADHTVGKAPIKQGSLVAKAYEDIKEKIITLYFLPGQYLNEAAISGLLQVGRTPVHQALQRLELEGLVEIMPRKGVV